MNKFLFFGILQIGFLSYLPCLAFCEPMDIFVSIPPQKWLCDQVGGTLVTTHVLIDQGQNPHTFEPTPKQIVALSRAKLYFTIGMTFEQRVTKKFKKISNRLNLIDVSRNVHKIPMNNHHHIEGQKGHIPQSGPDPHIWLSPVHLQVMAANMAQAMIKADPAHQSEYERNLVDIQARLNQLHSTITKQLAPYKGASVYVFHPAFGYFIHTYHLKQVAVEVEGKSPTPRQLASLITRAKSNSAKVIFTQPQFDQESVASIAAAIDAKIIPLNPLAEDVETNLIDMAGKIEEALNNQYGE